MNVLIIEDNLDLSNNIAHYFEQQQCSVDFAYNGAHGLELALEHFYDVIILDLALPKLDGLEVCKTLREKSTRHTPIIMLTARDTVQDKIAGFHTGADDYLTKPFALEELYVRCQVLTKRHLINTDSTLTLGDLVIDKKKLTVTRQNQTINLNAMGYQILLILAEAFPQVVTRSELTQKLWKDDPTESDALRSHIYQLRQQIDKPFAKPLIKTVHGVGFTLDVIEE